MGRHLHVLTPFPAEHAAPVRNAGWQTVSEEAQRSQRHNHPPDVNGEDNNDGCHNIGQDMADQDLARGPVPSALRGAPGRRQRATLMS